MLYEILVFAKDTPMKGKVCHYQEKATAIWGAKEVEPDFIKVDFDGDEVEVKDIIEKYKYDFVGEQFVEEVTMDAFDKSLVLREEDFVPTTDEYLVAKELNGGVDPGMEPCDFMRIYHINDPGGERLFYLKTFFPIRREPGMHAVMLAAKYTTTYSDFRDALLKLTPEVQDKVIALLEPDFVKKFQDKWGVLNGNN